MTECMFHDHPLYSTWQGMRNRCNNPNNSSYYNYGRRGITVCDRWNDFRLFVRDMGERPDGCTLDRIDNDGNYCPENCQWSTRSEQLLNRTPHVRNSFVDDPERNITITENNTFKVRIVINGKELKRRFKTHKEAIDFRATLEDERAINVMLRRRPGR